MVFVVVVVFEGELSKSALDYMMQHFPKYILKIYSQIKLQVKL